MNSASLWVLLASVAMLCLGHGLNGSLVSLAADQAQFSTFTTAATAGRQRRTESSKNAPSAAQPAVGRKSKKHGLPPDRRRLR